MVCSSPTAPQRLADRTRIQPERATVSRILPCNGVNRLRSLDPPPPVFALQAQAARRPDQLREWAYARTYQNAAERGTELDFSIHDYNFHRQHASLILNPPVSRAALDPNSSWGLHS